MEALALRKEVLAEGYINSVLSDTTKLTTRLVQLSNVLSKETDQSAVIRAELEGTVKELIQPALLKHSHASIRIVLGLCISSLFRLVPISDIIDENDQAQMEQVFNLLLSCFQMVEKTTPAAVHARSLLDRIAATRALAYWGSYPYLMKKMFDSFFDIVSRKDDNSISVHMSQIMIDCIEGASVTQGLVELLLSKLIVGLESVVEEEEDMAKASDDEESDDSMIDTQEAPIEKERRQAKKQTKEKLESDNRQFLLAADVLKATAKHLEPVIPLAVHGELDNATGIFSENLPKLVVQLCDLDSILISRILPDLQNNVNDVTTAIREKTVNCLLHVFLAPAFVNGCTDFAHLFTAFVGRFKDNEVKIRLKLVDFAERYLLIGAPITGIAAVAQGLKERLVDKEPQIRSAAIESVRVVACDPHGIEKLDMDIIRELGNRASDKIEKVRLDAARALAFIYRFSTEHLLLSFEADTETKTDRTGGTTTMRQDVEHRLKTWTKRFKDILSELPSIIISRLLSNELLPTERYSIDQFIQDDLCLFGFQQVSRHKAQLLLIEQQFASPSSSPSKSNRKRNSTSTASKNTTAQKKESAIDPALFSLHLISMIASLTPTAKRAFNRWLEEKKSFRDELRSALSVPSSDFIKTRANLSTVLEKRLGMSKLAKDLSSVKEELGVLVDRASSDKQMKLASESMVRASKKPNQQNMGCLIETARLKIFSTSLAKTLVELIATLSAGPKYKPTELDSKIYGALCGKYPTPDVQLQVSLDFLMRATAIHTAFVAGALDGLDNILKTSKNPLVTKCIARISSFTASLTADEENREGHIKSLAIVAQRADDSKSAAEASAALMAHVTAAAADEAEDPKDQVESLIASRIKIAKGPMSDRVASAFAALTPLVKLITSTQALSLVNHVSSLIENVVSSNFDTPLSYKNQSAPADYAEILTKAAVEGIVFVVNWYRTQPLLNSASTEPTTPPKKGSKAVASPWTPKTKRGPAKTTTALTPTRPTFQLSEAQSESLVSFSEILMIAVLDDQADLDHAFLRATAITGMLRLAEYRVYDELLVKPETYINLAKVTMSQDLPELVANELRSMLTSSLMAVSKLPLKYLPFTVLLSSGEAIPLAPFVEARREAIKKKTSQQIGTKNADEMIRRWTNSMLPENALPWLIFALAHDPEFENDEPKYSRTWGYLRTFLRTVLHESNFDFLFQMMEDIRLLDDALDPDSHNIHIVAELGIKVIDELRRNDKKKHASTNGSASKFQVFLPSVLFKMRYREDSTGKKTVELNRKKSYLSANFLSPTKSAESNELGSANTTPVKRKVQAKTAGAPKRTRASNGNKMDVTPSDTDSNIHSESDSEMYESSDDGRSSRVAARNAAKSISSNAKQPKRTTPARKVKKPLDPEIFGNDTSVSDESSTSTSSLPPPPPRPKRPSTSVTKKTSSSKRTAAMETEEASESQDESHESEKGPNTKRPKRSNAAAISSTASSKLTANSPQQSKSNKMAVDDKEEPDTPSHRTRSAQSSPKASTPLRLKSSRTSKSSPTKPVKRTK